MKAEVPLARCSGASLKAWSFCCEALVSFGRVQRSSEAEAMKLVASLFGKLEASRRAVRPAAASARFVGHRSAVNSMATVEVSGGAVLSVRAVRSNPSVKRTSCPPLRGGQAAAYLQR